MWRSVFTIPVGNEQGMLHYMVVYFPALILMWLTVLVRIRVCDSIKFVIIAKLEEGAVFRAISLIMQVNSLFFFAQTAVNEQPVIDVSSAVCKILFWWLQHFLLPHSHIWYFVTKIFLSAKIFLIFQLIGINCLLSLYIASIAAKIYFP